MAHSFPEPSSLPGSTLDTNPVVQCMEKAARATVRCAWAEFIRGA